MQPKPQLLQGAASSETVACLERLTEGAQEGVVVGLVVGVILNRRRYYVSICGEAHRDPTFARGVLGAVEDELRDLIHGRSKDETTV